MMIEYKKSSRKHWHCITYLNDGRMDISLPIEDAKELFYACLVNHEKAAIFEDVSKLLSDLKDLKL